MQRDTCRRAFKAAFPHTLPILAGFWFLGMAYGMYMNAAGFSFWYPMVMSFVIFGGSLEFVAVTMLTEPFAPLQVLIMTLLIQARHVFYGISMLERFKGLGWKRYYLMFGLCDETFSINYTAKIPEGIDRGWFMFFVTLLNHFYWVSGATMGGFQHGGAGFRHDSDVRCDFHGAMDEGTQALYGIHRHRGGLCLSDGFWGFGIHAADDGMYSVFAPVLPQSH